VALSTAGLVGRLRWQCLTVGGGGVAAASGRRAQPGAHVAANCLRLTGAQRGQLTAGLLFAPIAVVAWVVAAARIAVLLLKQPGRRCCRSACPSPWRCSQQIISRPRSTAQPSEGRAMIGCSTR
jgi:hypothetical protein